MPRLYRDNNFKDNCGFGLITNRNGIKSHSVITKSISALKSMKHRGGIGSDGKTGDGCGLLFNLDHDFYRDTVLKEQKIELPKHFAVAQLFLDSSLEDLLPNIESILKKEGLHLCATRLVPVDKKILGVIALDCLPNIYQLFISSKNKLQEDLFESALLQARKFIEVIFDDDEKLYFCSMSSKTIVYKGLMLPDAIDLFYKDLQKNNFTASICVFHQRFSTNTSPKWYLAQPFRLLAHNGEINAIRGNRNWAKARKSKFITPLIPKLSKFKYLINETGSDSSSLDNMMELLEKGGMNIFRAIRMVLPPAWQNGQILDAEIKSFHEYNSMHMEAWDGPAGIVMTDGKWAICVLDRNGLRPARFQIDEEGLITVASETGVNPTNESSIISKGRVKPGGILAINTETGELHDESYIDDNLKVQKPYREWLKKHAFYIESSLNDFGGPGLKKISQSKFITASKLFLLYKEERSSIIKPLAVDSQEGTGSMGDDTALAVMSKMHRQIYDFFRQQFAQVTNPPIDSLREKSVMSLETCFGPELNVYEETPQHAKRLITSSPLLSHRKLATILKNKHFNVKEFTLSFNKSISLKKAITNLKSEVVKAVRSGVSIIHLDEQLPEAGQLPINALLGLGAVHQELVKLGLRSDVNLVVSSASARDTHHIACLIGFGATAVFPWLAYQTILDLTHKNELKGDANENCARYRKGINKGLLKIISKMGISTISSYRGSQLFEIVGLNSQIVKTCFTNTTSRIEGKSFKDIDKSLRVLDDYARSNLSDMNVGGLLKYIHGGEYHAYNPEIVKKLQEAVSTKSNRVYEEYANLVDTRPPAMLRDLLQVKKENPIPLNNVENQKSILTRFDSAGMSLGALSPDAHETLAQAMNSIGGRSNSGEGGEAVERYGTDKMSKIKQIASGRFGVTPHYLVNAEVLQIKIAQGAKPGEGGQLPGGKVNKLIAKLRYSTPGVTLISPPPHHDIYSIEDLAQLIYDLKEVNPKALVSVKLVSEPGVGTIAAGVAKAYADLITISGHDGGTGASPLSSIRYAGSPWELGLAEAHQALRESGLRGNIRLQADGGMKTGLDVIKAAALGAESFGFGTGPMIAMGCKYLRICHLNNCATGVATQRKDIINHHFIGEKEKVVNYFKFIADDVRQHLSEMGVSKLENIIGQTEYLKVIEDMESQYKTINLTDLLYKNKSIKEPYHCKVSQNNPWDKGILARKILKEIKPLIKANKSKSFDYKIMNTDRSVGASASGYIADTFGETGLEKPITLNFKGSAGQSFGCWNANGLNIVLDGDANDYVGKGMNGGKIVIKNTSHYAQSNETTLVGNTCLYGATGGEIYVAGSTGERFAVRNSGAYATIEGAGDHCCEYMTGGQVTVLGPVGANFGAGMTGGFAYVLDEDRTFFDKCNRGLVNIDRIINEDMESHRKNLKEIILKHYQETSSSRSKEIYDDFDKFEQLFWLVSPAALNVKDLLKATTANAA
jgi:glutamate synthase (NADPH/NADH) large chain